MPITDDQNEIFDIVDEKDNVIGKAKREEVHKDKKLIHRSIGVVVFNTKGEMFLQKRSATKDTDPNKWTIACSGHVSSGDSYEETALRELKEELGLDLINFPFLWSLKEMGERKSAQWRFASFSNLGQSGGSLRQAKLSVSPHLPLGKKNTQTLQWENKKKKYKSSINIERVSKYICRAERETEMVMLFSAEVEPHTRFNLNREEITQGKFFTQKEFKEALKKEKIELSFMGKVALEKIGWG